MTEGRTSRLVRAVAIAAASMGPAYETPIASAAEATAKTAAATVADRVKARRAQQEGEAKLAKGDLEGALASFLLAVTTVPSAAGFLQIARLHDKLGHAYEAVAAYEAYLALAPTREVEEAKARVAELRRTPGHVVLRGSPASARIRIGDELVFDGFPVEVDLPPGDHVVRIEAEGFVSHEVILSVRFGESSSPAVDLEPAERRPLAVLDLGLPEPVLLPPERLAPAEAPLRPSGPSWAQRHRTGLTVGAFSLGALAVGAAFGFEALDAQRAFAASGAKGDADRGERAAFRADLAFGGAALLTAAAAVLLVHEDEAPKVSLQVAPFVGPGTTGVAAGGRF